MAVSIIYSSGITTNSTTYANIIAPTQGDLIIAIARSGATTGVPVCADDKTGGTYTLVSTCSFNTTAASMAVFIRNNFITTSSATLTFGWTGDAADGCCKAIYTVTGITRTGISALKQTTRVNNSASTTMRLTFSANVSSSNPVIAAIGNLTNPATITPPTGWNEGSDTGYATPSNGLETVYTDSTFNGTVIDWGSSSATACGALAVELDTSVLLAGGGHYRLVMGVGM